VSELNVTVSVVRANREPEVNARMTATSATEPSDLKAEDLWLGMVFIRESLAGRRAEFAPCGRQDEPLHDVEFSRQGFTALSPSLPAQL
jgi:hypothetical protein